MADIKSPEERSRNMAKIRAKDTKPEMWLRKLLFSKGYRYRKNVNSVPGHPDIWMPKYNTAIFVHGCYWHRHINCKYAYTPKSNVEFWLEKFKKNRQRDLEVGEQLNQLGIKVLVIWECSIKRMIKSDSSCVQGLKSIEDFLNDKTMRLEI